MLIICLRSLTNIKGSIKESKRDRVNRALPNVLEHRSRGIELAITAGEKRQAQTLGCIRRL